MDDVQLEQLNKFKKKIIYYYKIKNVYIHFSFPLKDIFVNDKIDNDYDEILLLNSFLHHGIYKQSENSVNQLFNCLIIK